ncbi:hypothetical protein BC938DRAFT_474492 [Jimgerdemannia flammicorona]|uniref:Uncharacterized protein n=1 Tax=Jimgerdemannia flammicorona TaxID=994334 RepID=A0A433QSG4_9FUNG|nr:hypothetical protein BC938DRAFT_474492 [Jimgerdemannia flammicorona]
MSLSDSVTEALVAEVGSVHQPATLEIGYNKQGQKLKRKLPEVIDSREGQVAGRDGDGTKIKEKRMKHAPQTDDNSSIHIDDQSEMIEDVEVILWIVNDINVTERFRVYQMAVLTGATTKG